MVSIVVLLKQWFFRLLNILISANSNRVSNKSV